MVRLITRIEVCDCSLCGHSIVLVGLCDFGVAPPPPELSPLRSHGKLSIVLKPLGGYVENVVFFDVLHNDFTNFVKKSLLVQPNAIQGQV